jgi:aldehyde dehydrogenase (NAD+)
MIETITSRTEDVAARVSRIRAVQPAWGRLAVRERLPVVRAFRHLLVRRADDLARAIRTDLGKEPSEIIGGEILPTADACRFLEREATRILRPRRVSMGSVPLWLFGQVDLVHRRPRGVVAIIGTWNYPLFLNGVQIVQTLTAGNGVLWKPSEVAPAFAGLLTELLGKAGFPDGLVQVLPPEREMGAAVLEGDVDHVVFTGSVPTGKRIAARLGERLISSTLELSGVDAQFVLDDADVEMAARAAWFGATANRGQTCIAVRRAFVQRPVYARFCDLLQQYSTQAPVASLAQPVQAKQAEGFVNDALALGGRLLVPGPVDQGEGRCRPAVIADARPDMALCREAAFAPVMAVLPFDSLDEALTMDSACHFGLGASIFTRRPARAQELAGRLRTGVVTVNDVIVPTAHPATPFGGVGESGWGVTQGVEGLLEMTVPQVVSVRPGKFRPHYSLSAGGNVAGQEGLVRGLLAASHAPTFGERCRGWMQTIRALWRGV